MGWSLRGEVANVLDSEIIVRKFKFQLCSSVHFWTNALWKGMNPLDMG